MHATFDSLLGAVEARAECPRQVSPSPQSPLDTRVPQATGVSAIGFSPRLAHHPAFGFHVEHFRKSNARAHLPGTTRHRRSRQGSEDSPGLSWQSPELRRYRLMILPWSEPAIGWRACHSRLQDKPGEHVYHESGCSTPPVSDPALGTSCRHIP